jgi:glycyl-tRNA synthetase beta chain
MTADLLFEIGVEELPASFIQGALEAMPELLGKLLTDARISHGDVKAFGTPRRIAVLATAVADKQTDRAETVLGPPASAAIGGDGKPTPAGIGFAKKQGLGPEAIEVVDTPKGKYVQVKVREDGKPSGDVLPALLRELCVKTPFKKAMRWGAGDVAFGRPVHWLVALHGDRVIDVEFAGVRAGRLTRGHRFLAPAEFELGRPADYVGKLREAKVLTTPSERRSAMEAALENAAKALGGVLVPDAFLIDECMALVECPFVVPGVIDAQFLDLPDSVIISVMRNHQRYFAVRDAAGKLLPHYLNVVNTANAPDVIQKGNDRVLRARLKDARFFVDEDRKRPLTDRVVDLDRVVYQVKLGSVGDRVRRMEALAGALGEGAVATDAKAAARLAKADLVSLIVGEFPELQGDMGRFYALEQGVPAGVANAIRDHYLPKGASDSVATDAVSALLAVVERADSLVGCFGIGLVPSGSADPFALRRAALGIVRTALDGPADVNLERLLSLAYDQFPAGVLGKKEDVLRALHEFFAARIRAYYGEKHEGDLVDACLAAWDFRSVRDLERRMVAIAAFRKLPEYAALATAFKRAFNIAKDAPAGEPDPKLFTDAEERALGERFAAIRPSIDQALASGDYNTALGTIARELREPIDQFFEKVFVMVDDAGVRENRLRLLGTIARTLTAIARFDQLSA